MQPLKIFISYTQADRSWAEWIAWNVEAAGHEARIQAWDFAFGGNFVAAMDEAAKWADVTIPVLSPGYLKSGHCIAEWSAAFAKDPQGKQGRLIPVRVRDFDVGGLLRAVVYLDLVGLSADDARGKLAMGLQRGRRKPTTEPLFPGLLTGSESAPKAEPAFPQAVFVGVPHRNPYFTGRKGLLKLLHEQLQAAGPAALAQAAIHGLGGVGKTQAAIEYVHQHQHLYRFVLWVASEAEMALRSSYLMIARDLELVEATADLDTAVMEVKSWLARQGGWLLVFDNADDPALMRDYLPSRRTGGKVLLTSRAKSFRAVGIRQPLPVTMMDPDEAVTFLTERTGCDEPMVAATLAAELGYLPLALEQAAAYVDTVEVSLEDYLASFSRRGLQLLEKGQPGVDYPESVGTTWNLSIDKVTEFSPASAELLQAAAFLIPDSIPIEIFTLGGTELGSVLVDALKGADEDSLIAWELLAPLERYSLVERLPASAFKLHRLTQEVVKASLDEARRRIWAERVLLAVSEAYPLAEYANWSACERLQHSAVESVQQMPQHASESEKVARLLGNVVKFAHHRFGDYAVARTFSERELEIRKRTQGPEHPDTLRSMSNLAEALDDLGHAVKAKKLHEQTLTIRKRDLGPEHLDTLTSMNNLGSTLIGLGEYDAARELSEQELEIRQRVQGSEHPDTLTSMSNLASAWWSLGDHERARTIEEQTLEIRKQVQGLEHPDTLVAMHNLAWSLETLGDTEAAWTLFTQAQERLEEVLGPEHPATTKTTRALLKIAEDKNDADARVRYLEKLRWLTERDEEGIASVDQRNARRHVLDVMAKLE